MNEDVKLEKENNETKYYDVPIVMGHKVECILTGYIGIVTVIIENLYRVPQYNVVPKRGALDSGKSMVFDAVQLRVIDVTPVIDFKSPKAIYKLGKQAECTVSGFKGVITAIETHMNGCIRYKIVNRYNPKEDKGMMQAIFDEAGIKIIEDKTVIPNKRDSNTGGSPEYFDSETAF